jgi:N-acyl-D-amino-acid deacylase
MMDLLIHNAFIVDGTGSKPFIGSVGIEKDKISVIEREQKTSLKAENIIDAGGLMLTPGFIDAHGHSDISILASPEATGKISQGITTEIIGNCGLSVFPVTSKNRDHLRELFHHYNISMEWSTLAEYANRIDKAEPAINIASLCGHNTLRAAVTGYRDDPVNNCDIRKMKDLLLSALNDGAVGISTGLLYVPGRFAAENELTALGKIAAQSGKIWTSHLRSEGTKLIESIDEFIGIASETGCKKIHISHLKTAGKSNWHKLKDAFDRITEAQKSGLRLTADRYPYVESMTQLSAYMPSPYSEMDDVALKNNLAESENYTAFIEKLSIAFSEKEWENKRIVSTNAQYIDKQLEGRTLADISQIINRTPEIICAELLKEDSPGTIAASKGMSEKNMLEIMQQPFVCCCTDESARPDDYSIGRSHPRGFGSFPKFMEALSPYLKIEEIIAKMTSLPAQIFGIRQRGMIMEKYFADLVLINPDKLNSPAQFANPHHKAEGIEKVWVNGKMTYNNKEVGKKRFGKLLL